MKSLICALAIFSSVFASEAAVIKGGGATFPAPLYTKWFDEYQKIDKEVQIDYQPMGSGAGINQFTKKTLDFGATDAPMNEEQLKTAGGADAVVHVPTVLGAVVVTYNLAELKEPLNLSADVIGDIFLGKITKWNDPRLVKLNPNAKLAGDIAVVHRADGSGTTAIFTDYLNKAHAGWKPVGKGTQVKWPVGLGGKGNDGVAGLVKQTPGAIGYVELIFAANNKLTYALVKNKAGKFVTPTTESVTAAADGALKSMPDDFRVSITDADGAKSYPISGFTYLLVWKTPTDQNKGGKLVKFLRWAVKDGQSFATPLHYAPLPKTLIPKIEAKVSTIVVPKT